MRFRGVTTHDDNNRPHWEPVFVCDSRLLCTMMLRAWNPDAGREMRRQLYRELYPDGAAVPETTPP